VKEKRRCESLPHGGTVEPPNLQQCPNVGKGWRCQNRNKADLGLSGSWEERKRTNLKLDSEGIRSDLMKNEKMCWGRNRAKYSIAGREPAAGTASVQVIEENAGRNYQARLQKSREGGEEKSLQH